MAASPDEIVSLAVFARVVAARSFTAAARGLGLSKSVVSARVGKLEQRLGVRLLHRTTRRLALTDDGLRLYERCAALVAAADAAAEVAGDAAGSPHGRLRLAAPVAFGERYLAEPLAELSRAHPGLVTELSLADRTVDLVEEGLDVAIRVSARLAPSSLVARRLARDRFVACAAPAYLRRRGEPAAAAELVHHDCLRYALVRASDEWRFGGVSVPVRGPVVADSGAFLRRAALAGMGIAVLPGFLVAEDLAAGALLEVLPGTVDGELGVYAVHAHGNARLMPGRVRVLIELLAGWFRRPRW